MSHYQPYPKYRKTGMKWLPKIPEHWEIVQSRRLFSQRKERANEGDQQLTASQKYGIVYQTEFMELEGARVMQVIKGADILKRVCPNDFVISMRSFQGGLEWSSLEGSISSAYVMLVPQKHVVADFFRYLFKSAPYIQALQSTSDLIRDGQALRFDNFAQVDLPIIPEDEQVRIAKYLDRETARIDALIEKKTRFIELLREKRQALITHAVTKSLDPNVMMKDSGVEWLGAVPEHWAICKLSFRYSVELGKMLDEKRITSTSLMPYLRNQDVQWDAVNAEDLPEMDIYPEELSRYTVRAGDLLVCEGGDVGRAAIWRGENDVIGYQKALHRLRPRNDATDTAEFFFFALMAAKVRGVFEESDSKATIAHLPAEKFRQYRFAFPPAHEQREIAGHIRTHTQRLDKVLITTERSIDLLKERRSALITAAVTGQIDLRDAV